MYYKLYRRRNKIYIIIGVILIIYLYLDKNNSSGNERKDNLNDDLFEVFERRNVQPKKKYVPPSPCVGCPGENGAGVSLTVIILMTLFFFIFYFLF